MKQYLLKVWMTAALSLLVVGGVWGQESYTPGYPNVSDITHESATLNVSASVGGVSFGPPTWTLIPEYYSCYVVLPSNQNPPSISQVLRGEDSNSVPVGINFQGKIGLMAPDSEFSGFISGLAGDTDYLVYLVTTEDDFKTVVIETTEPTSVSFSTITGPTPLTATLSPANDATNVPVSTSTFEIRFSEDVEMADGTFYAELFEVGVIEAVDAKRLYSSNISNNVVSLSFNHTLEHAKEYEIVFPVNAIKSVETGALFPGLSAGDWSFTTEAEPDPLLMNTSSLSPLNSSVEVPRAPTLEVSFNQAITWGPSGVLTIHRYDNDATAATISRGETGATISQDKLSIIFSSDRLEYGTEYYVIIDEGFVKALNTSAVFPGLSDKTVWTFTTETAPPVWVDGYPNVSEQDNEGFKLNVLADVPGTVYAVVTSNSLAPSVENISNGKNVSGGDARIAVNEAVGSEAKAIDVRYTNQTPLGSIYYLHIVYQGGGAYPKFGEVRTIEIDRKAPSLLSSYPMQGAEVFPISDAIVLTFTEDIVGQDNEELNASYFSLVKDGESSGVPFSINKIVEGEIAKVIIKPDASLDSGAAYTLIVSPVYDLSGNVSEQVTINFATDKLSVWTGQGSPDNILDAANWEGAALPTPGKSVLIRAASPHYPSIIEGEFSVHNLTIEAGAVLTHTGGTLSVSGTFHLQSSPGVNASYINKNGTISVNADSVRIDQYFENPILTYLISSPTKGSTVANFGGYFPLSVYDNKTDTWPNVSLNDAMQAGVGYRMWTNDKLVTFSGQLNSEDVIVPLTRTKGKGFGWNLVGNPYPSAIDWEALNITETSPDIENNFWLWLPTERRYGAYSAATSIPINIESSIIPSNHAFLVKVKLEKETASITFSPTAQVPNNASYLKSSSAPVVAHVKFAGVSGAIKDEIAIAFIEEASFGLDKFDLEKRFANQKKVFELFTNSGTTQTAINAIPLNGSYQIPLGYNALQAGDFAIEMLSDFSDNVNCILIDKEQGVEQTMRRGDSYNFSVEKAGKSTSRFELKFINVITSADSPNQNQFDFELFVVDKGIYVSYFGTDKAMDFEVIDLQGRTLRKGELLGNHNAHIGEYANGMYIIKISDKNSQLNRSHKVAVY